MFSGAAPLGGPLVTELRNRLLQVGVDVCISQGLPSSCFFSVDDMFMAPLVHRLWSDRDVAHNAYP